MQLTYAAAALVATASASGLQKREYEFNSTCNTASPYAKVVNRCSYPVYLWSVEKQYGCPDGEGLVLNTGDFYNENFQSSSDGGVSIKLSKFPSCGGHDITQLEYKIDTSPQFGGNYLDMSFVDCKDNLKDCPGRTDGFYLKSGNEGGIYASAVNNEHCPIFSVNDAEEAAAVSYINWDDRQTKFCNVKANLLLALCGGEEYDGSAPAPSTPPQSSEAPEEPSSAPEPIPTTAEDAKVEAAAITEAPEVPVAIVVKTEVVYVTEFIKRHAHGGRHQHFKA